LSDRLRVFGGCEMSRKILTIILLLVTVTAACLAPVFSLSPENVRTAGCHGQSSPLPSPLPVSHKCCHTGHQTAVLQEPAKLRSSLVCVWLVAHHQELLIPTDALENSYNLLISSGSPPVVVPLRI